MGTENKITETAWKNKAKSRRKEIKVLKKELIRQTARAEKWRAQSKVLASELSTERSKSKSVNDLKEEQSASSKQTGEKPVPISDYKYPLLVIWLSINLYKSGLSLRGVCDVLAFIRGYLGLPFKVPSYGTIRIWVQKTGLYLLEKGGKLKSKSEDKWCLIVDESYSLGKSQLLVILGVRLNSLKLGSPLSHQTVYPLLIQSRETWKAEAVSDVLVSVSECLEGRISYVVSDKGNNLVSAYAQLGLPHVPDWGHYIANVLEKCYAQELDFKLFNEKMGAFKKKRKQSQFTDYTPPNLSVKVRFMNYIPFLEWANEMLGHYKAIPKDIIPDLAFLQDLKPFIGEMTDLFYTGDKIGKLLKKQGICPTSQAQALGMLKTLAQKYAHNSRVTTFIEQTKLYFEITTPIYLKYTDQTDKLPQFSKALIASSDVIESLFGKFKHRALKDPKRGFCAGTLIIPLFCRPFSPFDVFNALNKVNAKKLNLWINQNLTTKKYTSFRNVFKKKLKKGGTFNKAA